MFGLLTRGRTEVRFRFLFMIDLLRLKDSNEKECCEMKHGKKHVLVGFKIFIHEVNGWRCVQIRITRSFIEHVDI